MKRPEAPKNHELREGVQPPQRKTRGKRRRACKWHVASACTDIDGCGWVEPPPTVAGGVVVFLKDTGVCPACGYGTRLYTLRFVKEQTKHLFWWSKGRIVAVEYHASNREGARIRETAA